MDETQTKPQMDDDSVATQADESRSTEAPAVPVARLLANPRRIRRN